MLYGKLTCVLNLAWPLLDRYYLQTFADKNAETGLVGINRRGLFHFVALKAAPKGECMLNNF
jgi:hypothetical protein